MKLLKEHFLVVLISFVNLFFFSGNLFSSALIRLLHECVSNGHFTDRFTQAILKSIWRITKGLNSACKFYTFVNKYFIIYNYVFVQSKCFILEYNFIYIWC